VDGDVLLLDVIRCATVEGEAQMGNGRSQSRNHSVLLVYKKSQLQLARQNRNKRIEELLAKNDVSVAAMTAADALHQSTLKNVSTALKHAGCDVKKMYRASVRPEHCEGRIVVCVGGDGTVLDASHRIIQTTSTILGVNSSPGHSIGFLCAADTTNFASVLDDVLSQRLQPTSLARLYGDIDGKSFPFPVLNDVLIGHSNPASTSRYLVSFAGTEEDHRSSGVWVSTATGSSAALASAGGEILDIDDVRMQLRARELFVTDGQRRALSALHFSAEQKVTVTSKMREGRVWLDGPYNMLPFPTGARLTLSGTAVPLSLVVTPQMAERRSVTRREHVRVRG
jgi:NAD+ kinase